MARLLHPLGMYVGPQTLQFQTYRVGILLTLLVMLGAALLLLWRFLPALI